MSACIGQSIDAVCKEKGIDREVVIEAVKEAVRAAARKQFKSGEEIQVEWAPETGLEIFASKVVVEEITNPGRELSPDEARELAGDEVEVGDELQLPLPVEDMGRIAAQTAKQILFQKVRDGERAKIAVASTERDVDPVGACVGMKGSRVQAIIRELRGEKIDIIEWSDEPSVFAANALSPAKVNQVRITDIERRQMEVIVNEDQLSLAIGKRGQNVRLATKLVGWNIDIRSEEELKREVALQMGAMIASGEAVPLERLEGMNPTMVSTLAEHGISDIESLASATVDDLADFLDVSIDQAESLIAAAQAVVESARIAAEGEEAEGEGVEGEEIEAQAEGAEALAEESPATEEATAEASGATAEAATEPEGEMAEESEEGRTVEQHAASVEADPNADVGEVEPSEAMIAEGYDEAVETRPPFMAEDLSPDNLLARDAAEPVALTEVEQMSADELLLQGAGRDLRPDTITPAPDIFSAEAAVIQNSGAFVEEERPNTLDEETSGIEEPTVRESDAEYEDSPVSPRADFASEASAPEVQVSSEPSLAGESAPTVENVTDDEAEDASSNE